jgi:hypothetical protein
MKKNEIDLIAIGEGRSGKTHLLRKIVDFLRFGGYEVEEVYGIDCESYGPNCTSNTIVLPSGTNAELIKIRRLESTAKMEEE